MFNLVNTAYAQVATSSIQLPAGFTTDIINQGSTFFANMSPFITMVVSVLFALLAIGVLISYIRR